ncbi:unnamed protein product [marine sediment metagenome]|uniref:Uncharacterized protein n=1 Tax=marine sediment metagenome TaxID=412755 RepID=X1EFA8_9ZZZZ
MSKSLISMRLPKEASQDALLPEVRFWAGTNSEEGGRRPFSLFPLVVRG